MTDPGLSADSDDAGEEVDAVPVLARTDATALAARRAPGSAVARQAAAVAVGSFAAGVATVVAVRAGRSVAGRRRAARVPQVLLSRSFLVDVHLLAPRD